MTREKICDLEERTFVFARDVTAKTSYTGLRFAVRKQRPRRFLSGCWKL